MGHGDDGHGGAFAFDIETIPLPEALDAPYPAAERQPPANYRSLDAIERWRERDREAWEAGRVKTASLTPRLGRVLAIGTVRAGERPTVLYAANHADEVQVLTTFGAMLAEARGRGDRIVTWAGKSFDLPFLLGRCLLTGTGAIAGLDALMRRYATTPHCDVREVLTGGQAREGESLDAWALAAGLPTKPMRADDVYDAWRAGRHDDILAYAAHDARTTLALYQRLAALL